MGSNPTSTATTWDDAWPPDLARGAATAVVFGPQFLARFAHACERALDSSLDGPGSLATDGAHRFILPGPRPLHLCQTGGPRAVVNISPADGRPQNASVGWQARTTCSREGVGQCPSCCPAESLAPAAAGRRSHAWPALLPARVSPSSPSIVSGFSQWMPIQRAPVGSSDLGDLLADRKSPHKGLVPGQMSLSPILTWAVVGTRQV